jgi:hypothetical protein
MRSTRWFRMSQQSDATLNDSDKTFTVPSGKAWRLVAITARLISTATVGNRQLDVLITDGSDNLLIKYQAGAVQAASLTRDYHFAPNHPQDTGFTNGVMLRALGSDLVLPAGYKVRVYDSAAIHAAADDLTARLLVEELEE